VRRATQVGTASVYQNLHETLVKGAKDTSVLGTIMQGAREAFIKKRLTAKEFDALEDLAQTLWEMFNLEDPSIKWGWSTFSSKTYRNFAAVSQQIMSATTQGEGQRCRDEIERLYKSGKLSVSDAQELESYLWVLYAGVVRWPSVVSAADLAKHQEKKKDAVGARLPAEIIADPMATAAEILSLSYQKPLEALRHPNCPVSFWWELAEKWPIEAQASVLYSLFTLEEPSRWAELEKQYAASWVGKMILRLREEDQECFAAACALRALPFFEKRRPNDKRPREAIRARWQFAKGSTSEQDLTHTRRDAQYAFQQEDSQTAVGCAALASYQISPRASVESSASAFAFSGVYGEAVQQWHLLQEYLRYGAPSALYGPGDFVAGASQSPKESRVGARLPAEIIADPQASEDEVRQLPGLSALAHPNCPTELWWQLAASYPIEAMESPAYDLMTLDTPERWTQMESTGWVKHLWFTRYGERLSEPQRRLLAADLAEHVLPLFEQRRPKDKRPRKAIEAARAYARGTLAKKGMQGASVDASVAESVARQSPAITNSTNLVRADREFNLGHAAASAAMAAYMAAELYSSAYTPSGSVKSPFLPTATAKAAVQAVFSFSNATEGASLSCYTAAEKAQKRKNNDKASTAEFLWQWALLQKYLRENAPAVGQLRKKQDARDAVQELADYAKATDDDALLSAAKQWLKEYKKIHLGKTPEVAVHEVRQRALQTQYQEDIMSQTKIPAIPKVDVLAVEQEILRQTAPLIPAATATKAEQVAHSFEKDAIWQRLSRKEKEAVTAVNTLLSEQASKGRGFSSPDEQPLKRAALKAMGERMAREKQLMAMQANPAKAALEAAKKPRKPKLSVSKAAKQAKRQRPPAPPKKPSRFGKKHVARKAPPVRRGPPAHGTCVQIWECKDNACTVVVAQDGEVFWAGWPCPKGKLPSLVAVLEKFEEKPHLFVKTDASNWRV